MATITLSDVGFETPDGTELFSRLSLSLGRERVGLVGRNGIGKTSLLRIIGGEAASYHGTVSICGTCSFLRQVVQVPSTETLADLFGVTVEFARLRRAESGDADLEELYDVDWTLEERVAAALGKLELGATLETRLADLSGGQRTRADLAAAVFERPDFLLLDEPTNNLDRAGRDAVIGLLTNWKAGALVVSHDRELLEHMDAIVEMTTLGVTRYGGGWSDYRERKAIEMEAAHADLSHAEKQLRETARKARIATERMDRRDASGARRGSRGDLPRILLGSRKNAAEATGGNAVRLADRQQARATGLAVDARSRIERSQDFSISIPPTGLATGRQVLTLEGVAAGYDPDHPIVKDVSFSLVGPERLAIVGDNGTGKSTLLKVICGKIRPLSGVVRVGVRYALLDQRASLLDPSESIADNFTRLNPGKTANECRAALASFLFRADVALQKVGSLSGGQVLRVGLACVLGVEPPPLLILDEPTNHLDIASIEAIEAALAAYDGALIVVSHDEEFLARIGIGRRVTAIGTEA